MSDLEPSPRTSGLQAFGSSTLSPAALVTIRMQELHRSLATNYTRLLKDIVFASGAVLQNDRKLVKYFRKTLTGNEANIVLSILWKESTHVTENELAYDGHSKLFVDRPLTSYHLAVYLAGTKNDVAATNSRVRLIVAAGVAFGLIGKRQLTPTKIYIFGTELLHNFMVRLGLENANSCARVLWQNPDVRISADSFIGLPFYDGDVNALQLVAST